MKLIDGDALEKAMTVAAVSDAKVIDPEKTTYGQQNFEEVASDNTDYTLTCKDGIYSVTDKYGHMTCEFIH